MVYAIGEILLVMIGILLALQVNNWNQNRLDRQEEQRLLRLIYTEMDDYLWLEQIGTRKQIKIMEAGERLLMAMKNPLNPIMHEEIGRDIHTLYSNRWFAGAGTSTNIYDLLINGGKFGLISSKVLQNALAGLKENFGYTYDYNLLQTNFIDSQLSPFLNKHIDRVSISGKELRLDSALLDSPFETSYDYLLKSKEFSNLIAEYLFHTKPIIGAYGRINRIITQIDSLVLELNPRLEQEIVRRDNPN